MPRFLALLALAFGAAAAPGADWKPAPTPLMTRFGAAVTPENCWREYPRPQLVRSEWQNLNGLWDYAIAPRPGTQPAKFDGKILVPFCAESALSGVGKPVLPDQYLWYRRDLQVPPSWAGKRTLLHFGAVDYESVISIDGKELLTHRGGSDPFSVDITDALKAGKGELVVRVYDPTDTLSQPRGKQVLKPSGIFYTAVTGIWQTVWLECVPQVHLTRVVFTPDLDKGEVECLASASGPGAVTVTARPGGAVLGSGSANTPFRFKVATDKPWTPDTPNLTDVTVALDSGDRADSYFAVRKISLAPDKDGQVRMMLNNKFVFQFGPLDQGWWPDGLLTPPSDAALRSDVEYLKKIGCNLLRKHIKVEPATFYRHCDELGMLVWQDMPSGFFQATQGVGPGAENDAAFTPEQTATFETELKAMIDHLRGFASIVVWVPYNEGWGQHDTNATLKMVQAYDPSRLVDGPSGWQDRGVGAMIDAHIYPGPGIPPERAGRARVLGEYGGLGLPLDGHTWQRKDNWGYRTFTDKESLAAAYHSLMFKLHPLIGRGLSAAVYTQTTDVEGEVNGYLSYDRAVEKIPAADLKSWHDALKGPPPITKPVLATSETEPQTWAYRFDEPGKGWATATEARDGWKDGPAGFGTEGTPNCTVHTEWGEPEIWLRKSFDLKALPGENLMLRMYHDEDAEVYLNGVLAVKASGYNGAYDEFPVAAAARKSLKLSGNVIAIHCKQTVGGQFVDAGLVELVSATRAAGPRVLKDIAYGPHARNKFDLTIPASEKPLPLLIWVHGGGWAAGDKSGGNPALLLQKEGYAVAAINYRLSQHAVYPAQLHDCQKAVRYLREHAGEYNIDPERIGVWGASAGGHLVALLGATAGVKALDGEPDSKVSVKVQAVCDWFGPTDLAGLVPPGDATNVVAKLVGGPLAEKKEVAATADPVNYLDAADAPLLIIHGTVDQLVPLSQSVRLYEAARKAKVPADLIVLEGAGHGDGVFRSGLLEEKQRGVTAKFFAKYLKPAAE